MKYLEKEQNKLEKSIACNEAEEIEMKEKLNVIYKKQQKARFREQNKEEHSKDLPKIIQLMIKTAGEKGYPKKPVCNHFGVHYYTGMYSISLSGRSYEKNNNCQIVLENKTWVGHKEVGCSKRRWNAVLKSISKKWDIIDYWNGNERSTSISIEIKKRTPEPLKRGLLNYHNHPNVFGKNICNFGDRFEKKMAKAIKKSKFAITEKGGGEE